MNETPNTTANQNSPPTLPVTPVDQRYKGVGGWLKLFCFILVILNPLLTIGTSIVSLHDGFPYISRFHGLLAVTIIDILLSASLMTFSVYAGIGLWRIRPNAVKTAKRCLLCYLGYFVIAAILPFMAGLPSEATDAMLAGTLKDTFRGFFFVAIWHSYLSRSKRVKATYEL